MLKLDPKNPVPLIEIEMFPASFGDSFLISFAIENNKKLHLLIDCGFKSTYKDSLRKRLKELSKQEGYLSRLIITHIDKDHINGALPFLEENGLSTQSKIIKIEQIWHNSFRHMQFEKKETALTGFEQEVLKGIKAAGFGEEVSTKSEEKEIGAEASMNLGALILKHKYNWNTDSFGDAICTDLPFKDSIHPDITIQLLSPSREKLKALENDFIDAIEDLGIGEVKDNELFNDAYEYMVAKLEVKKSKEKESASDALDIKELSKPERFSADTEAPNGSSIAFVLTFKGKKLLFLGDAHSEQIENELEKAFPENEHTYPIFFDAIKISHHGSNGNTGPELLKIIDSDTFLISTNGKGHHHPHKETIARIVNRPITFKKNNKRNLYFNYETETSKLFDNQDLKSKYKYDILYPKNSIKISINDEPN